MRRRAFARAIRPGIRTRAIARSPTVRATPPSPLAALVGAALVVLLGAAPLAAQTFPERPISLVVPFVPGGAADTTGRIMAEAMARHLGQSTLVENASGAGGTLGSAKVRNAPANGYTIGLAHTGTHAASVATYAKLPYDPRVDFDYLGIVSTTPNLVYVRKDFPGDTLAEFIAYARAKGADLKIAHSGIGSAGHITCILLFQLIGTEPTYVPYRGFGQSIQDTLAGRIDGSCDLVVSVGSYVKAGSIKVLAVAADARSPALPNVPTAAEAGLPAFKAETWTGLYAPKGIPAPALARLREAVAKSLAEPALREKLANLGAAVPSLEQQGGDYMLRLVEADVARWIDIMKKAGVEPQ